MFYSRKFSSQAEIMTMKRALTKFLVPQLEVAGAQIYPDKRFKKLCARIVILFVFICGFFTIILFISRIAANSQEMISATCYIIMTFVGMSSIIEIHY